MACGLQSVQSILQPMFEGDKLMKNLLTALLFSAFFLGLPAVAADQQPADQNGYANATSADDGEFEALSWNRWQCSARPARGWGFQTFFGTSHYFEAGSGEGQYARSIAELIATRDCEYSMSRRFFGDFRNSCTVVNCQVQRH